MSDESAPTDGRVAAAFARLKNWMLAHAPLLAENLAAGAPTAHLDAIEEKLGCAFPADLRELWLLHDGQTSEQNGFVGALDLFTAEQALSERDGVLMFVDFLQQAPSEWAEAGVTDDEARSDRWLPFAGRDSDTLAVNCVTGRVVACGKDAPPLHLVATSVTEWIEQYADRVERGAYKVEEGFGDYFLSRDDAMFCAAGSTTAPKLYPWSAMHACHAVRHSVPRVAQAALRFRAARRHRTQARRRASLVRDASPQVHLRRKLLHGALKRFELDRLADVRVEAEREQPLSLSVHRRRGHRGHQDVGGAGHRSNGR
jgi:cell wall assembly regulator SMI1